MNDTTLERGDGPNEESHGGNEREHEKGESNRRFGPQNLFTLYGLHQRSPSTIKIQVAFFGFVRWNTRPV